MQDRPTAPELLEAAEAFLRDELSDELSGRKRFMSRVVANVLGILRREWEDEEACVGAEWERLTTLLGLDEDRPPTFAATLERTKELNARLADAIRAGELDDRWDETLDAVYPTVVEKLRIANPSWEAEATKGS